MAELSGQSHRGDDQDSDDHDRRKTRPDDRRGAVMPGLPVVIVVKPAGHGADSSGDLLVGACSAELRDDLGGEEVHVVQVGHVENLQVNPMHADLEVGAELVGDLRGGSHQRGVAA